MDGRFVAWISSRSAVSDSHEADKNEKRTQSQSDRETSEHRAEARTWACSRRPRALGVHPATSFRRP